MAIGFALSNNIDVILVGRAKGKFPFVWGEFTTKEWVRIAEALEDYDRIELSITQDIRDAIER